MTEREASIKQAEMLNQKISPIVTWVWSYDCSRVDQVCITADGTAVVALSRGTGVILLDKNGKLLWNHEINEAFGLSVSADGSTIAVHSTDGSIRVLDREGVLLWKSQTPNGVGPVAVSRDGSIIGFGSGPEFRLFNRKGKLLGSHRVHTSLFSFLLRDLDYYGHCEIWSVSTSDDGSVIAFGTNFGDNMVYLASNMLEVRGRHGTRKAIDSISCSADGSLTAVAYIDGLRVLDNKARLLAGYAPGYRSRKYDDLFGREGNRGLAYASPRVCISGNDDVAVAGCWDSDIYLFDKACRLLWRYPTGLDLDVNSIFSVSIARGGSIVAVGTPRGKLFLLNQEGELLGLWESESLKFEAASAGTWANVCDDGSYIVAGYGYQVNFFRYQTEEAQTKAEILDMIDKAIKPTQG